MIDDELVLVETSGLVIGELKRMVFKLSDPDVVCSPDQEELEAKAFGTAGM